MRTRRKNSTWLSFMNVSKAHNTAWRETLWRKMWGCGVEESFVNTKGVEARVVVDVQQSRWFRVAMSPLYSS